MPSFAPLSVRQDFLGVLRASQHTHDSSDLILLRNVTGCLRGCPVGRLPSDRRVIIGTATFLPSTWVLFVGAVEIDEGQTSAVEA